MPDAIRHHWATLKSFIYHERQLIPIDDNSLFEDNRDVSLERMAGLRDVVDLRQINTLALCASPPAAVRYKAPTYGIVLTVAVTEPPGLCNLLSNLAVTSFAE